MDDRTRQFGDVAQKLAKNPLGILALFIVLVYGFASLVATFGTSFTPGERQPLIYFMVLFPVVVLGVFGWLVSKHSTKLFAPGDFRNEDNYVRTLHATASLAVAAVKGGAASEGDLRAVVASVQETAEAGATVDIAPWSSQVLWVDDHPGNNLNERQAFEAMGLTFTLAYSTSEALAEISAHNFAAIISDMERAEGAHEGHVLLDAIRAQSNTTPFFVYASSNAPEYKREIADRGGQGSTSCSDWSCGQSSVVSETYQGDDRSAGCHQIGQ